MNVKNNFDTKKNMPDIINQSDTFAILNNLTTLHNLFGKDIGKMQGKIETFSDSLVSIRQKIENYLIDTGVIDSKEYVLGLNSFDLRKHYESAGTNYTAELFGPGTKMPMINADVYNEAVNKSRETNLSFFDLIPCFEEGYIKMNTNLFLYWKVEELDVDRKYADITLCLYAKSFHNGVKSWQILNIAEFSFKDINIDGIEVAYEDQEKIEESIDCKVAGFTDDEIFIHEKVTNYAGKRSMSDDMTRNFIYTEISMFLYSIVTVNKALTVNKPSKGRKVVKRPAKSEKSEKNTPEKLTRTIRLSDNDSGIEIVSEKVPRKPSEQYVRHYSVAAWTTRATVRHYKSGKTVYVKESVHHRHALQKTDKITAREVKIL